LKERVAPKNLNEGKGKHRTPFKVFGQAFFKKLAVSKGSALVAFRRKRNFLLGFSFCKAFSFGPFASKEKALWTENQKGYPFCKG
jgi:hypothetical protein